MFLIPNLHNVTQIEMEVERLQLGILAFFYVTCLSLGAPIRDPGGNADG